MLYKGRIIFSGTPNEVKNTADPIVLQFKKGQAEGPITANNSQDIS
jgi:phospholipid/cholesterol/gamma-HCH transport system ATP-binding protein